MADELAQAVEAAGRALTSSTYGEIKRATASQEGGKVRLSGEFSSWDYVTKMQKAVQPVIGRFEIDLDVQVEY